MQQFKLNSLEIAAIIHGATSVIPRLDGSCVLKWEEMDDNHQQLAANAVKEIYSNPLKSAEEYQNLWMKLKIEDGWSLGNFDLDKKLHPSLLPFNELPESEIAKDLIWQSLTSVLAQYYYET